MTTATTPEAVIALPVHHVATIATRTPRLHLCNHSLLLIDSDNILHTRRGCQEATAAISNRNEQLLKM